MKKFGVLCFVLTNICFFTVTAVADKSADVPEVEVADHQWLAPLSWTGDLLIWLESPSSQAYAESPVVRAYSGSGKLAFETALKFPETERVQLFSSSVDTKSSLVVVSAAAWNYSHAPVGLLCLMDRGGRITKVVRMNDFVAQLVRVSADGNIWCFGTPLGHGSAYPKVELFRRYSSDGVLLNKFMLRSEFPTRGHPTDHVPGVGSRFLVSSSNTVGAYVPITREWLEFDLNGQLQERIPVSGSGYVAEVAMTDSGDVYAWLGSSYRNGTLNFLDKKNKAWRPVKVNPVDPPLIGLDGADGNQLVRHDPYSRPTHYIWTQPPSDK